MSVDFPCHTIMIIMNIVERYYNPRPSRDKSGKHVIYLRAYVNGSIAELGTTRVKIDLAKNWCKKSNSIKDSGNNKDVQLLSERLEASKQVINDIVTFYNKENVLLTSDLLKEEFQKARENKYKFQTADTLNIIDLFNAFVHNQSNMKDSDKSKLSYNTLRDYTYKLNKLNDFCEEKKIKNLTVARIDKKFVFEFKGWLINSHNNTESSANKYIMRIKTVLNFGVDAGMIRKNLISEISTPQSYERNILCLSRSQAIKLHFYKFKVKHIQRAVDMYVFSCFTGICHADQIKLKNENYDKAKRMIIDTRQKTKTKYTAPVCVIAERIINKYGSIEEMPKISNQKCNDYIKIALYEIGVKNAFDYTFHSGRKTFVNYCLNRSRNSVNPLDLIKIVGHSNISELKNYGERSDSNVINSYFK